MEPNGHRTDQNTKQASVLYFIPRWRHLVAGRPRGATSWWRNAANFAAHHANVLLELWLAGAPVHEVRVLLLSLAHDRQHQALIEECWHARGAERRQTVPAKIKRKLCRLAVAHVTELRGQWIIQRWVEANVSELRRQGYSEPQITEIMSRRAPPPPHIDPPPLAKIVELVGRHAPPVTLRRKARDRILRR